MRTLRDKRFTRSELRRLGALGGIVAVLHLAGWTLFLWYARTNPALAGLGMLAYTFGLRHAFDADHIAAIDNTSRRLLQRGRRSMGVGFFFSIGHSSIVLGLTAALAFATKTVGAKLPTLQSYGGAIGMSVSGAFLLVIGLLNLAVLLDIFGVFRALRRGRYDEEALERRLLEQGLMSRLFLRRIGDRIDASWKMAPLGALFGLGFDTASEVALLAVAAGVATHHVPFLAVISLPILFAAGMSLMDTIDGAFMSRAYGWAFASPVRKVYYNMTVTTLSVLVALMVGGAEIVRVLVNRGPDVSHLGYVVVALFAATWVVSALVWKVRGIERRWASRVEA
ncbi:MAG: HoxN/HupN/NixA family nickel/cobalt transporter [Gaiellaceae bacterium]